MDKLYALNSKTKKLHIVGFCPHSNNWGYRCFDSEEEAIASAGPIQHCKKCAEKHDEFLRRNLKKEHGSN